MCPAEGPLTVQAELKPKIKIGVLLDQSRVGV